MGKKKPVYFVASDRVEKGDLCAALNVLLQEAEFHAYKRYRREGEIDDEWLLEDLASFEMPLLHNLLNQIEDLDEAKDLLQQGLGMLLSLLYGEVLTRARQSIAEEGPMPSKSIH